MQPTVIWKIICALSGIFAIRESDSNASKTVLEKLMRTNQSYTAGQTSQDLAYCGEETQSAENEHENELGVQPVIEEVSQAACNHDGHDEHHGQLNRLA